MNRTLIYIPLCSAGDRGKQQAQRQKVLKVPEFPEKDLREWWLLHDAWLNKEDQVCVFCYDFGFYLCGFNVSARACTSLPLRPLDCREGQPI